MSSFVKSEPSTPSMSAGPSSRASVPRSAGAFRPKVKKEEAVPELDADGGANFSDYKLVSNGQGGWNYNVIKFHSSANAATDFDPLHLPQPALLNRKDPRPRPPPPPPVLDEHGNVVEELKPVLDEKGKPMLGPDGKVMFATGKKGPTADLSLIAPDGGAVKNRKNLFKKKTKQIFKVSQDRMRLRREERHPWVLEGNPDGQPVEGSQTVPGETWVGRMEDTGDKSFVMFVFEDDKDEFQIMDVRRWYKFQQRPTYNTLNQDEAEEMYARTMKGKDPRRWVMQDRTPSASAPSGSSGHATGSRPSSSSRVKVEDNLPSYLRRSGPANGSSGAGGGGADARPKQEKMDWEDDGGEEGGGRRRNEGGGEGDADADFEDEFSDDDGQMEFDQADEAENKELEERLKREFRQDGTAPDADENAGDSDDDDLFGDEALKGEGKAIKKALKKNTRGDAYASDDEQNPYASEDDSDSDSPPSPPPSNTPATTTTTASGLLVPSAPTSSSRPSSSSAHQSARHSSPGGAALLAHRSISPKRSSRPRSRSGSPGPAGGGSSPVTAAGSSSGGGNKRKAEGGGDGGKKVRLEGSGSGGNRDTKVWPAKPPSEREVVNYIRNESPDVPKLFKHFKRSMKSDDSEIMSANKTALIAVVKKVADLVGKVLVCKAEYAAAASH